MKPPRRWCCGVALLSPFVRTEDIVASPLMLPSCRYAVFLQRDTGAACEVERQDAGFAAHRTEPRFYFVV